MTFYKLSLLFMCFPQVSNCQISPFEIFGTISGTYDSKMYLFFEGNYRQRDSISSDIKDGHFYFKGVISMPVQARLHMDQQSFIQDIYIDGPKTFVNCTTKMNVRNNGQDTLNMLYVINVKGSKTEKIKIDLTTQLNQLQNVKSSDAYKRQSYFRTLFTFIKKHPRSKLSPYFLGKASSLTYQQVKELRSVIDTSLNKSYEMKSVSDLLNELDKSRNSALGVSFRDFVLKDSSDSEVSSIQFRGKYTLIVVWASWCKPCRSEHAELNLLYEKYKSKGLEMIGLSFDKIKAKWTQAIVKDKLQWTQVIDTNAFEGDIAKYYDIDAIPANFLLDREGKIIGTSLSTEEIVEKLEKSP